MSSLQSWLYKHAIITVLLIIWCIGLVTWVTYRVFSDSPPDIPTGTVAAFGTLFGLPTLVIGLWKWRNKPNE
jgi:hypothetical protein